MTVAEVLRAATEYLERKGVDSPRLDAELILSRALGLSRLELYTQHDRPLTRAERDAARGLVDRRGRREPLAYVLGEWGFRRLTLKTDARALVPRPETEVVVERALELIADVRAPRVLDVGTGSGAIALAVKDERPDADVMGVDVSEEAVALARENAAQLRLDVVLVAVPSYPGPAETVGGTWDLVVSNPPYVDAAELDELQPELSFEPRVALVDQGQTDMLIDQARHVLNGWLVLEVHEERADEVVGALRKNGYARVTINPDLAGRARVVVARWETPSTR